MFHIKSCINIEHRLLISSYQLKTKFVRGEQGGKETFYSSPLTQLTSASKNTISMKLARENISAVFSNNTKHNFFYMKNTKIKVQVLQRGKT